MKNKLIFIPLLLIVFTICSCKDYSCVFPVTPESKAVHFKNIEGNWKYDTTNIIHLNLPDTVEESKTEPHKLLIKKISATGYEIKLIPIDKPDSINYMQGWFSKVVNDYYANIKFFEKGKPEEEFLILNIKSQNDTLYCRTIHADSVIYEINESAHLYKFLKENQNRNIWNSYYRYIRE
jgi:hypothetical protein